MSNARNLARLLPNASGQLPDANLADISAGKLSGQVPDSNAPSGSIVQVVTGELTSYVVYNNGNFGDIGLQATITPSSVNNKIYISVNFGRLQTTQSNGDHGAAIRLLRNGIDSDLNGIAAGSRPRSMMTIGGHSYNGDHSLGGYGFAGVDAPATTSAITYKLQAWNQSSSYPLIINGTAVNGDGYQFYHSRTKAIITLMEIAA